MRLKPRRRARIAGRHRRPRPYRAVPDLAPQTWRAWEAQNGGKRWYRRLPLAIEWALEWFVHWLRGLALFDLLELAGKLTVVVAIIFWFLEADQRARQAEEAIKERHYRAWELINAARGSTGDGGRRDALQDLNKDRVSLAGAPLEQAWLPEVDLTGADLWVATLQHVNFRGANLQHAFLLGANLNDANLNGANLQHAFLLGANLSDATLQGANLQGANLKNANLRGAHLMSTDLRGATLQIANLQGADLSNAILWGTILWGANLNDANLGYANLQGALDLTQEQLDTTFGDDQTQIPDRLTRPAHWSKAEGSEGPPAAQPDEAFA